MPRFTFSLERVRSMRERTEDEAREALARQLAAQRESVELVQAAAVAAGAAREAGLGTVLRGGATGADLIAAQHWIERAERTVREAALERDARSAEVELRRSALAEAAREREAIEKLKSRRRADHEAEWARRAQGALDEIALAVHRRRTHAA
jgi:flagellar FliJ protein